MAEFDIRQQMSEKEQDNALRPLCFADFAGQSKVTSNLKIFVEAAKLQMPEGSESALRELLDPVKFTMNTLMADIRELMQNA